MTRHITQDLFGVLRAARRFVAANDASCDLSNEERDDVANMIEWNAALTDLQAAVKAAEWVKL